MIDILELHNIHKLKRNVRNDLITQSKNAQHLKVESDMLKRRDVVYNCDHEFIVYAKENSKHDEILECVHCGLTNKYTLYEKFLNLKKHKPGFLYDVYYNEDGNVESYESKLYKRVMKTNKKANYISHEELRCDHLKVIYNLSRDLVDDPEDNAQIFNTMKDLVSLENKWEEIYIHSVKDTKQLLRRYKNQKINDFNTEEKDLEAEIKYIKL